MGSYGTHFGHLLTLFCFFPLGIPGIVNASGVSSAYASGNIELARQRSERAKMWIKWSFLVSVIFWVIWTVLLITGAAILGDMFGSEVRKYKQAPTGGYATGYSGGAKPTVNSPICPQEMATPM